MNDIAKMKQKLIREIKGIVTPYLRDSGYRKALDPSKGILGGTRSWQIWTPKDAKGRATNKPIPFHGILLYEFEGLSEDGPVIEFGMGANWVGWSTLPLEDLIKLKAWAIKTFNPPVEVRPYTKRSSSWSKE